MLSHDIISGLGQTFTCKSNNKIYPIIGLDEIRTLVDNPQSVPKEKARWALPSAFHSRSSKEQPEHGSYLYLWADLDTVYMPIDEVRDAVESFIDADYEIYTTRSATKENQKARVLIPLANAISPSEWHMYQGALNKLICEHQIVPDDANKRYAQFFYLPNRGDFYRHLSRRQDKYFNPTSQWNNYLDANLSTESTEITDDYRGVQKNTEITEVIDGVSDIDYTNFPSDCCPKEEGQRNRCLFTFGRYLKYLYTHADFEFLRPLVLGWHNHFIDVIGTKSFSETWTDFRRGWLKIKVPYGQGIESIIESIDLDLPIPQTFIDLGYGAKEFKLLLISRQLQLINGEEPFFLAVRTAGTLIDYHYTGAGKMLDTLVADGFLELITKGKMGKASRYRCIWDW